MEIRLINHENEVFKLSISDYMLPFNHNQYFESNWLKGEIEISKEGQTKVIQLEFLQIEELIGLIDWIDRVKKGVNRTSTIFDFIDPNMRFRIWKKGNVKTVRFIYHSEEKDTYSWELIINERNLDNLMEKLKRLLKRFPIR